MAFRRNPKGEWTHSRHACNVNGMTAMMSAEATKTLIDAGTNRQGAVVVSTATPAVVTAELIRAGLIGEGNGLTRRGTIVRQRALDAALNALFA